MSISLKNHEDRIKVLEAQTSTKVSMIFLSQLSNGKVYTVPAEYKIIFISHLPASYAEIGETHLIDLTLSWSGRKDVKNFGTEFHLAWIEANGKITSRINNIIVHGLKLYYSFSYNIIYRATHLLEKIFYVLNKGGVSL